MNTFAISPTTTVALPKRKTTKATLSLPSLALLQMLLDAVTVIGGFAMVETCLSLIHHELSFHPAIAIIYSSIFVLLLNARKGYTPTRTLLRVKETEVSLSAWLTTFSIMFALHVFGVLQLNVFHFVLGSVAAVPLLLLQKYRLADKLIASLSQAIEPKRVLIYGTGTVARRLYSAMVQSRGLNYEVVGFLADEAEPGATDRIFSNSYHREDSAPIFSEEVNSALLQRLSIDAIFVASGTISAGVLAAISELARRLVLDVTVVGPQLPGVDCRLAETSTLDGISLSAARKGLDSHGLAAFPKRALDASAAGILLFLSSPIWAFIAIAVAKGSKGPVFFRQKRVGKNGKTFEMLKFRSMYVDAPTYCASPSDTRDPRITPLGRWLRKSSLDELPQLWNVLRGDMSLVGPRPEMPFIVEKYGEVERQRLLVDQGLTGLWQLSADRKYAIHESIEYDLYYIENRSFLLDVSILLHTLVFAMRGI